MRLAGVDLNLLVILDALLTESSVTGAAQRVGLSQSATSHALGRLRDILGDPILLRTTQGMVPTARAESLAPVIRRILDDSEAVFLEQPAFDPSSSRETFRIALDESAQLTMLPPLVKRLQRDAPEVSVVVAAGTQPNALRRELEIGNVDTAVTSHFPSGIRDLRTRYLLSTDHVTIARRGHPALARRLTLKRFAELGHVTVTHPSLADRAIDRALAAHSLERRVALSVPAPAALPFLVARTDLVATLPRMLLDLGGAPRNLVRQRPPVELEPVPVFLIHHERTEGSAPHQWFRDQIAASFEALGR